MPQQRERERVRVWFLSFRAAARAGAAACCLRETLMPLTRRRSRPRSYVHRSTGSRTRKSPPVHWRQRPATPSLAAAASAYIGRSAPEERATKRQRDRERLGAGPHAHLFPTLLPQQPTSERSVAVLREDHRGDLVPTKFLRNAEDEVLSPDLLDADAAPKALQLRHRRQHIISTDVLLICALPSPAQIVKEPSRMRSSSSIRLLTASAACSSGAPASPRERSRPHSVAS
eukprot:scaffold1307_cov200-Pinguiococcus_pyrenoidosus.AAC.83